MATALDEQEIGINQSAAERREHGLMHIGTNDPYWIRRLEGKGTLVRVQGDWHTYTIENRQLTIRSAQKRTPTGVAAQAVKDREYAGE